MRDTFVTEPSAHVVGDTAHTSVGSERPCETTEDWAYAVASNLQRLALRLHDAEREDFEQHFRQFTPSLREAPGPWEALWLKELLLNFCVRAALSFDRRHHPGQSVRCAALVMPPDLHSAYIGRPRSWLCAWLRWFLRGFDDEHGLWLPLQAVRLLRKSPRRSITTPQLARSLGCTPGALERAFHQRYGLSPKRYQLRVRARSSALLLRASADKVSYMAWRSGYDSIGSLYRVLGGTIGLTPTGVRQLSSAQFEDLLNGPLETNPGRLVKRPRGSMD